jgi:hypothetical protein
MDSAGPTSMLFDHVGSPAPQPSQPGILAWRVTIPTAKVFYFNFVLLVFLQQSKEIHQPQEPSIYNVFLLDRKYFESSLLN